MAYNNLGTPVFYVDEIQYLKTIGSEFEGYLDSTEVIQGNFLGFNSPITLYDIFDDDFSNLFGLTSPGTTNQYELTAEFDGFGINMPFAPYIRDYDFSGNIKFFNAILNHNLKDCWLSYYNYGNEWGYDEIIDIENPLFNYTSNNDGTFNVDNGSSIIVSHKNFVPNFNITSDFGEYE